MTSAWRSAVLGFGLAVTVSSVGCDSDDETTPVPPTSQGGGSSQGGSGGSGGSGAQAGSGGAGGSGGALSGAQFCEHACPLLVDCGEGGAGGDHEFPRDLQGCQEDCPEVVAACSAAELQVLAGCLSPHVDPDCDFEAFLSCGGTATECMDTSGAGGG